MREVLNQFTEKLLTKGTALDLVKDIKPNSISVEELDKPLFLNNNSEKLTNPDIEINKPVEQNKSYEYMPRTRGTWEGVPGDSVWKPDSETVPKRQNPEGKTWGQILDEHNIEGIEFKDGYPNFENIAEESVTIKDFTDDRNINFNQADKAAAEKWNAEEKEGGPWTGEKVKEYRKENQLTWHEHEDMNTLQLVPSEVHGNIPHSGGVAAKKSEILQG